MRTHFCEKFVGAFQCGAEAGLKVFPDSRDPEFWYACEEHAPEDGHQTVNGGVVGVEVIV